MNEWRKLRLIVYPGAPAQEPLDPPRYPCIPEAMAVANDDEWDDETYARQQVAHWC